MIKDPLINISQIISNARNVSGISIESLSAQTKVSIKNILSIEAADRAALPEETFLYGYIKKILKTLNIPSQEQVLEAYKKEQADWILQEMLSRIELDQQDEFRIKIPSRYLVISLVLILLILSVFCIKALIKTYTNPTKKIPASFEHQLFNNQNLTSLVLLVNVQEALSAPIVLPEKPKQEPRFLYLGSGKHKLRLLVLKPVYLRVLALASGSTLIDDNLHPAEIGALEIYDDEGLVVFADDASALLVDNGSKANPLGREPEPIQWYYPKTAKAIYKSKQKDTKGN